MSNSTQTPLDVMMDVIINKFDVENEPQNVYAVYKLMSQLTQNPLVGIHCAGRMESIKFGMKNNYGGAKKIKEVEEMSDLDKLLLGLFDE